MLSLLDPQLSSAIEAQEAMLHPLAMRLRGRDGADYDDLMQEGRMSVWQDLLAGREPQEYFAWQRMLKWIRHIKIQNPKPYAELFQLTDG
jgi:DNA-directed RNA polymerase specialized sigma24 family protein